MVTLTKIDGNQVTINADEIESVETLHDTVVSLKSGRKIIVRENQDDIISLVIAFRKRCSNNFTNDIV